MFDHLNAILYKKKLSTFNTLNESTEFVPFLVQRWCTMHSSDIAVIVNETTNRYWPVYDSKQNWFVALDTVIPKCKFKKIAYFKKAKKDIDTKEREYIQKIANTLEISTREVISYIKDNNLKLNLPKNND